MFPRTLGAHHAGPGDFGAPANEALRTVIVRVGVVGGGRTTRTKEPEVIHQQDHPEGSPPGHRKTRRQGLRGAARGGEGSMGEGSICDTVCRLKSVTDRLQYTLGPAACRRRPSGTPKGAHQGGARRRSVTREPGHCRGSPTTKKTPTSP